MDSLRLCILDSIHLIDWNRTDFYRITLGNLISETFFLRRRRNLIYHHYDLHFRAFHLYTLIDETPDQIRKE